MYSLFTTIFPMFVIIAIITEWRHTACFLYLKKTFIQRSIKLMNCKANVKHQCKRLRREPSECSRVAPPGGDGARYSQEWSASLLLLLAEVTLVVEVAEEDDERDAVAKHKHVHGIGEVALGEQVVARVEEEEHELHLVRRGQDAVFVALDWMLDAGGADAYQLQRCEVFLPPQVLLHVRADGCQAVVRVHDDVDEGVHQADEEGCSGVNKEKKTC